MLNFIDGLLIGILGTIIYHKLTLQRDIQKMKAATKNVILSLEKDLKETENELPIEREEDNE